MKIIIAGGRDFNDSKYIEDMLRQLMKTRDIEGMPELICGMAKGADLLAKSVFDGKGLKVLRI